MSGDRGRSPRGLKMRGHLSVRALAGIRAGAVVVSRPALTRSADIHELICPHRVDEVTQVFVVKVARQETRHVDLNKCKTQLENNELPDIFSDKLQRLFLTFMLTTMLSFYFINFGAGAFVCGVMRLFVSDVQHRTAREDPIKLKKTVQAVN